MRHRSLRAGRPAYAFVHALSALAVVVCAAGVFPHIGRAQAGAAERASAEAAAEITAFVERTGRVVFTNLASAPFPASAPVPTSAAVDLRETSVPTGGPFAELIDTVSGRHGVHPTLVRAVIEVESAYNPLAISPKNARGLMQLIPDTGRRFGVRDFFNPRQNIEGGVQYLRFLLEKFDGDMDLSLAAYNAGENLVGRLGRIPNIPETVNYVRKVRAAIGRMGGILSPLQSVAAPTTADLPDAGNLAAGPPRGFSDVPIAGTVDVHGVRTFSNLNGY
jgi:soluble lytic murein transglycosylase-like protein